MTALGAFLDLCSRAAARGLHVELHCGTAKETTRRETYRDLTELRLTIGGEDGRIPFRRSTSWASLDEDARVLLDAMARIG